MIFYFIAIFVMVTLVEVTGQDLRVLQPSLPNHHCPTNETYRTCSTMCEDICGKENQICPPVCGVAKCQCTVHYYRNSTGKCVLRKDCPKNPKLSNNTIKQSCASIICLGGQKCVMKEPTCNGTLECNPVPICTSNDGKETAETCNKIRCRGRQNCVLKPFDCVRASCKMYATCEGTTKATTGNLTCANVRCMGGQRCEMKQVNCVRAPCPPRPTCVSNTNNTNDDARPTCSDMQCEGGYMCAMQRVRCLHGPCYPVPSCANKENLNILAKNCSVLSCQKGSNCVLKELQQCNQQSCDSFATCERSSNTTATVCTGVRCPAGTMCRVIEPRCMGCKPIGRCVRIGQSIGSNDFGKNLTNENIY